MSEQTLKDIEERFVYRDMAGIDGTDVTYLLNRIAELKARLLPHTKGRANTHALAEAVYDKQCEFVGADHKGHCVKIIKLALDSCEDRIAELKAQTDDVRDIASDLLKGEYIGSQFDVGKKLIRIVKLAKIEGWEPEDEG